MMRVVAALCAFAACGRIDFDPLSDGGVRAGGDGSSPVGFGSGTISAGANCTGTANPFDSVAAAYSIGHVSQPGQTDIYLVDHAIRCDVAGVGLQGWDQQSTEVPNGTQVLGLLVGATTSGTYAVSLAEPPAANAGFAIYYGLQRPVGSGETSCISAPSGGTITITVNPNGSVSGSYSVMMQGGNAWTATGTFEAVYCAIGWYPTFN